MRILIENVGAQKGYLILENNGQWLIEAVSEASHDRPIGASDRDSVTMLQSIPIENTLPTSIINYVARSQKSVILSDATRQSQFTNDRYILEHREHPEFVKML